MKITKPLAILLLICTLLYSFAACDKTSSGDSSTKYEALPMKETVIVSARNNSWNIEGIIDFEKAGISNDATIIANSEDETMAKYSNNKISFGNQCGETTVEFIVGNKKGTVSVKVVSFLDYLKSRANDKDATGYDKSDYYAAQWLVDNLENFKNPSSVSVNEVWTVRGDVTTEAFNASYFIMEIRAQNGFGGYGVDYYKVTSYGIERISLDYNGSYNGSKLYKYGAGLVNQAVKEYIEEKY